jgi:hypothetical protein
MSKDKLKITVAEAHVLRDNIKKIGLQYPDWFELLSYEELAECYNGAGSDETPELVRKVLTRLLGFAQEAVLIHDAEYHYSSRFWPTNYFYTDKFYAANKRLGENAHKLAIERTPWYSVLRYWRMFVAREARRVCNELGYDAWTEK